MPNYPQKCSKCRLTAALIYKVYFLEIIERLAEIWIILPLNNTYFTFTKRPENESSALTETGGCIALHLAYLMHQV